MRVLEIRHKLTIELFKEASKRESLESRAKWMRPIFIHPLGTDTAGLCPQWMDRQFWEQPSAGEKIWGPWKKPHPTDIWSNNANTLQNTGPKKLTKVYCIWLAKATTKYGFFGATNRPTFGIFRSSRFVSTVLRDLR